MGIVSYIFSKLIYNISVKEIKFLKYNRLFVLHYVTRHSFSYIYVHDIKFYIELATKVKNEYNK